MTASEKFTRGLRVFVSDIAQGFFEITHNGFALLGLAVVAAVVFAGGRADLRHQAEVIALDWLQTRHEEREVQSGNILAAVGDAGVDDQEFLGARLPAAE